METKSFVTKIILGVYHRILPSFMVRKQKEPTVPSVVLENGLEACSIYVVSRCMLITNSVNPWSTCGMLRTLILQCWSLASTYVVVSFALTYSSFCLYFAENSFRNWWCAWGANGSLRSYKLCGSNYFNPVDHQVADTASSLSDASHLYSLTISQQMYPNNSDPLQESNHQSLGNLIVPIEAVNECSFAASTNTKQVTNCFSFASFCCIVLTCFVHIDMWRWLVANIWDAYLSAVECARWGRKNASRINDCSSHVQASLWGPCCHPRQG